MLREPFKETYSACANLVDSPSSTVLDLIYTITWSVQVVVELRLDAGIKWRIVIGVSRIHGEVVISLILNQRIVPAIST